MTEQELRLLVREAIARHVGAAAQGPGRGPSPTLASPAARSHVRTSAHSHLMFVLPESDGPCLIEPAVPCSHCGFCKSFGH